MSLNNLFDLDNMTIDIMYSQMAALEELCDLLKEHKTSNYAEKTTGFVTINGEKHSVRISIMRGNFKDDDGIADYGNIEVHS